MKYKVTIAIILSISMLVLFGKQKIAQINPETELSDRNDYEQPNIIVILSDDMGFSDIGCYGAEINTPNLDGLAEGGIRFRQFYNAARCCPTRASLLTGLYPHQAGVGYMTRKLGNTRAYQGHLRHDRSTIADLMNKAGYTTLHVGKWHVGNDENQTEPLDVGFERGWYPRKKVDYWNTQEVYEDGKIRQVNNKEAKYLTDVEGDKAIEYIEYAAKQDKPFFMYLAFNAAHWPLHAKPEDIEKYRGKYLKGWDALKQARLERLDSIGLSKHIDPSLIKDPSVPAWDDIPNGDKYPGYHALTSGKHDQDDWDMKMAVYAAQIDCMDQNIGRIVNKLKTLDVFDNTVIIYLQDNGACAEHIGLHDNHTPGGPDSYIAYHMPWAHLGNTPFKMYKHFVHEGGISTPFIFHWPNGLKDERKGTIEQESFGHLIDIVPTCLDLAGMQEVEPSYPLEGQSLLPVINSKKENSERTIYWEHEGNRAIRKGDWKLISRYKNDYRYFDRWQFPKASSEQEWELYNVADDRWELNEISSGHPEIVEALKEDYKIYYQRIDAVPRTELIQGTGIEF